jgi:ECF transporter S component (folate family)
LNKVSKIYRKEKYDMKFKTKDLVTAAILLALAIVLPSIVHFSGVNGAMFSPMHLPVLLAGLLLGPVLGFFVGIISPILNTMISGMPQIPFLWVMVVELGIYGLMTGIFYRKTGMKLMPSLIISMILGRLGGATMVWILATLVGFKHTPMLFLEGATITALPGIIIQLIFVPLIVKAYERNNSSLI